jgi:hypothetical protein
MTLILKCVHDNDHKRFVHRAGKNRNGTIRLERIFKIYLIGAHNTDNSFCDFKWCKKKLFYKMLATASGFLPDKDIFIIYKNSN